MNQAQPRERGTLQKTLPSSLKVIFFFWAISVISATSIYQLSIQQYNDDQNSPITTQDEYIQLFKVIVKVAMGSMTSILGFIHTDPAWHSSLLNVAMIVAIIISDTPSSISVSSVIGPAIFYALTSLLPMINSLVGSIGKATNNCFSFFLVTIIFISSIIIGTSFRTLRTTPTDTQHYFLITPSILVGIICLGTFYKYYIIRAHSNGALLKSETMGKAVMAGLVLIHSSSSLCTSEQDAVEIMPVVLGSIVTLLFSTTLAITADSWYTVGTGQFQMVSVDTLTILFYFVLPICILGVRTVDKYHEWIEMAYIAIAEAVVHLIGTFNIGMVEESLSNSSTFFQLILSFLLGIIVLGMPFLNNLCTLCGHLYGRIYTHGQPNTGKVAICVAFNDLNIQEEGGREKDTFLSRLKEWGKSKKGQLNIFVSLKEMENYPTVIRTLVDAGHSVGVRVQKLEGSADAISQLKGAVETFQKLIGKKPTWYHGGQDDFGRNKNCYSCSQELNLQIAQWSTILEVGGESLSTQDKKSLADDLTRHNGGCFVYITSSRTGSSKQKIVAEQLLEDVFTVLSSTTFGTAKNFFMAEPLDLVAKEDNYMDL